MGKLQLEALDIFLRLCAAGFLGIVIGFERRVHHKAIGIAGMMLISIGSTTYMLLARHLAETDPAAISRTLQGFLSGVGFLGGAVIFKSGFDVKGIKAAAAIWITGALGLAIATSYWPLGLVAGAITALTLFVADSFPDEVREEKQEPEANTTGTRSGE
jgi:putative Mg2+ transporter-C (MgtC) family protein